jgi:hypothetical protein
VQDETRGGERCSGVNAHGQAVEVQDAHAAAEIPGRGVRMMRASEEAQLLKRAERYSGESDVDDLTILGSSTSTPERTPVDAQRIDSFREA